VKTFDPSQLFEKFVYKKHGIEQPFPTLKSVLDGARSGAKPLSRFGLGMGDLVEPWYMGLLAGAVERDLAVVLEGTQLKAPFERLPVSVYVGRADQLWRVTALKALSAAAGDRAMNRYESRLLGYSKDQTRRCAEHLERTDSFRVYTLLTSDQKRRVTELGKRCFGSTRELCEMTFFMRGQDDVLKRDAFRLVPEHLTLARTKLNYRLLRALLGDREKRKQPFPRLTRVTPSRPQAAAMNKAMREPVELLTRSGWR
jgi:hypothetical protein